MKKPDMVLVPMSALEAKRLAEWLSCRPTPIPILLGTPVDERLQMREEAIRRVLKAGRRKSPAHTTPDRSLPREVARAIRSEMEACRFLRQPLPRGLCRLRAALDRALSAKRIGRPRHVGNALRNSVSLAQKKASLNGPSKKMRERKKWLVDRANTEEALDNHLREVAQSGHTLLTCPKPR